MTRTLRITVGLDAERASTHALDWAIRQAIGQPAQITLVTAYDDVLAAPREEEAHLEFARARIAASTPGTPVETEVGTGPVVETDRKSVV